MNHAFGRRAVTTAVTVAAAAGALLAAGTAASASPNPATNHSVVSHAAHATPYGDRHEERSERGDGRNERFGHDHDRRSGRDDRNEYRGDHRYDGHRYSERSDRYWYGSDHGRRHHLDGHGSYQWERGRWITMNNDTHGFAGSISD